MQYGKRVIGRRGAKSQSAAAKRRRLFFAIAAVLTMTVSSAAVFTPDADSDAASPASGLFKDYAYQFTYSTSNQQITSVMKDGVTVYSSTNTGRINTTHWYFDSTTGIGPFNCFYAAIELGKSNGDTGKMSDKIGHVAYILDPADLTKAIVYDGETSSRQAYTIADYNIMLVIPTVYWYSDAAGNMYISNTDKNPRFPDEVNSKMVPYAHTSTDGPVTTVFPFLAIGVYESQMDGTFGLLSKSGVAPTNNRSNSIQNHRANADLGSTRVDGYSTGAPVGTYQLWNFYEWTLYKIMAQTIMGSKDAITVVGKGMQNYSNGPNPNPVSNTTGRGNTAGWFGSNNHNSWGGGVTSSKAYSKLLIENSWGSLWEYVDNAFINNTGGRSFHAANGIAPVVYKGNYRLAGDDFENPPVMPSGDNARITTTHMDSVLWDVPKTTASSGPVYRAAYYTGTTSLVYVGGAFDTRDSANLSAWYSTTWLENNNNRAKGSRLAYLMTEDAVGFSPVYKAACGETQDPPVDNKGYLPGEQFVLKDKGDLTNSDPMKVFVGWEYGDTVYSPGEKATMKYGATLNSKWAYPIVTLKFTSVEGTGIMPDQQMAFDTPTNLRANEFVFPEHSLLQWTGQGSDGKTYTFTDEEKVTFKSSSTPRSLTIELEAQWMGDFPLSYDVLGGSDPAPLPVEVMATGTVTLAQYYGLKEAHTFGGWMYEGTVYWPGQTFKMPYSAVLMSAYWIPDKEPTDYGEEDEDDIIDILNHNQFPRGQTRSSTLNIAVITAAVALCVAFCLVLAVWRRT